MKTLVDAGLVAAEKRGLWVNYRLRPEVIGEFTRELCAMVGCGTEPCGK